MTVSTATILQMPITFQAAFANTVTSASINRAFTTKTLADMIAAERPVDQQTVDGLAKRHTSAKELNNAVKRLRPIIYFGRFIDGARTRTAANIEAVTALVHDYDGRAGDKVTMTQLLRRCVELGIEVLVYETFSADDSGTTFRAIYPMREELAVDCYQSAQIKLRDALGFGPGAILPATQGMFITPRPGRQPNVKANFGKPVDELLDFFLLEAVADAAAPVGGGHRAEIDPLDMEIWNDEKRELFTACLPMIEPWSDDRAHWIGIIGAGLRGYGITPHLLSHSEELNEAQRGQIMRLEAWSKDEHPPSGAQPKYSPGCVVREGIKLLNPNAPKVAGLRGVVEKAHNASPEGIEYAIEHEGLKALALRTLGIRAPAPVAEISIEDMAEAVTKRQASKDERRSVAVQQMSVIHDMPACFGHIRDVIVEFASKGELTKFSQLTPDYKFKIDPITAILCVAQMYSVVVGGRVWVDQALTHIPLALNLYVLQVAGSGVGKSQMLNWTKAILKHTAYGRSVVTGMSFSLGGFWPNTFDRIGANVLQLTDEGESLIGGTDQGNLAANLSTLHNAMLSLYNDSGERGEFTPPSYSTAGKQKNAHEKRFSPVAEPHLNIFAIGVGSLVDRISNLMMMTNGFSARFIVRITPQEEDETRDQRRSRHAESCYPDGAERETTGTSIIEEAEIRFAGHLSNFDNRLAAAGRGYSMSQLVAEAEMLNGPTSEAPPHVADAMYMEAIAERQLQVRTNQYMLKNLRIAELQAEAEEFFDPYLAGNELLAAIKNREAEKLQKLGAIYTLAVNPEAKWMDPDITEYMLRILQLAQQDWIGKEVRQSSIPLAYQHVFAMLKREVEPGGLLYEADANGVPATKLRDKNRAWRKLISHLNIQDDDLKGLRTQAKQMLDILNVRDGKIGKAVSFYLTES